MKNKSDSVKRQTSQFANKHFKTVLIFLSNPMLSQLQGILISLPIINESASNLNTELHSNFFSRKTRILGKNDCFYWATRLQPLIRLDTPEKQPLRFLPPMLRTRGIWWVRSPLFPWDFTVNTRLRRNACANGPIARTSNPKREEPRRAHRFFTWEHFLH